MRGTWRPQPRGPSEPCRPLQPRTGLGGSQRSGGATAPPAGCSLAGHGLRTQEPRERAAGVDSQGSPSARVRAAPAPAVTRTGTLAFVEPPPWLFLIIIIPEHPSVGTRLPYLMESSAHPERNRGLNGEAAPARGSEGPSRAPGALTMIRGTKPQVKGEMVAPEVRSLPRASVSLSVKWTLDGGVSSPSPIRGRCAHAEGRG